MNLNLRIWFRFLETAINYTFKKLKIRKVYAGTAISNKPMLKLLLNQK